MDSETTVWADVSVPSPAAMVIEAEVIVAGSFAASGARGAFKAASVIKGPVLSDPARAGLAVIEPAQIIGFDLGQAIQQVGPDRVLLLGAWDAKRGAVVLKWYGSSIWPSSVPLSTFPSGTYDDCARFVHTILGYQHAAAAGRAELVAALLHDADGPGIYAALDFSDVGLPRHLDRNDRATVRQVLWSLCAALAARRGWDDPIDEELGALAGFLPPSLLVPHALDAAEKASPRKREHLTWIAQAALAARHLTSTKHRLELPALRKLYHDHRGALQTHDAELALDLFDSPYEPIRDRFADLTLEQILAKPRAGVLGPTPPPEPARRKDLWKHQLPAR
ncbi:MAG TPA: hypothetical protein VFH68_25405 [Polyangia bacterium]|nr:hypothetical protein [Polyangia bacterium]